MVRSHGVSQPGAVRANNEDCFAVDDQFSLFIVADGMGGHAAGEVAAQAAVDTVVAFIRRSHGCDDVSWPCGLDVALSTAGNRVRTAIHLANRNVWQTAGQQDEYVGMGTTLVCALICEGRLVVGHVGDSRLYLLSKGVLQQQTRDDTWVAMVLEAGSDQSASELAKHHPMRNVLTNALGLREHPEVHVSERDMVNGEVLLLCTDGVHQVLDVNTLRALLSSDEDPRVVADAIVGTALERGSRDNVTAVVVHYASEDPHA